MEKNDKSTVTIVVMGIIIFLLFSMWSNQRREGEETKKIFAIQTYDADKQESASVKATQIIENKIKGCVTVYDAANYAGTEQCVFGEIVDTKESAELRDEYTPPEFTFAYFDFMPNVFYLFSSDNSRVFFSSYVGDCVMVWGKISIDYTGTPVMSVREEFTRDGVSINLERLPDDVCR